MIPFDEKSPLVTSGIRIGTPALTSRGMAETEMVKIGHLFNDIITNIDNDSIMQNVKSQVSELCSDFPLYGVMLENEMS